MVSLSNHAGLARAVVQRFMVRQAHHEAFSAFSVRLHERRRKLAAARDEACNTLHTLVPDTIAESRAHSRSARHRCTATPARGADTRSLGKHATIHGTNREHSQVFFQNSINTECGVAPEVTRSAAGASRGRRRCLRRNAGWRAPGHRAAVPAPRASARGRRWWR